MFHSLFGRFSEFRWSSQFRVGYIKCYWDGICVGCIIPQLVVSSPRNCWVFWDGDPYGDQAA